jgi:hypothetical protein
MAAMIDDDEKTLIDPEGLRYKSKAAGSPFGGRGAFAGGTMSCLLCGKHRPRGMLKSKSMLGRNERVCSPSCKELDEILNARTA